MEKARSIRNNADTLELDRQSKLKLYREVIDLNPVDKRNYPWIAGAFPEYIESICSTCSFFAAPIRLNDIISNIAKNSEYNVNELEGFILKLRDGFGVPENALTYFKEQYNENVLASINSKMIVLSNSKELSLNAVVSALNQINTEIQKSHISLEETDILSKIKIIADNALNDFANNLVNTHPVSYESCIARIDKEREKLKINGSFVGGDDAGYGVVRSFYLNKLSDYANTLSVGENNISDCFKMLEQKSAEYSFPFDDEVSKTMRLLLTNHAVNVTVQSC